MLTSKQILVVDSDKQWCLFIKNLVSHHSVAYTTAVDQGLTLVRSGVFDLYIAEMLFPGFQIALCNLIRHRDPNAPVIFCSSDPVAHPRPGAVVTGRRYYLRKPCDPKALLDTVESCLTAAELQAMSAKIAEEAAIHDELLARTRRALARTELAHAAILQAEASMLRLKAYQAFESAGGSRAHFARWWPLMLDEAKYRQAPAIPQPWRAVRPVAAPSDTSQQGKTS
jgi:DNA-binding NtrC family response regulator